MKRFTLTVPQKSAANGGYAVRDNRNSPGAGKRRE
jgi:hypothetical protein